MKYSQADNHLRIELDAKNCSPRPDEIEKMESNLGSLRTMTREFPISDLYITIYRHPRSNEFKLKTSLVLTGRTLFTADHDKHLHPAFLRCVRKLVAKLRGYLDDLGNKPELAKREEGTRREVVPAAAPDGAALQHAIDEADYPAFRRAASVYEGPVRERASRWINRYPELEAKLGHGFSVNDAVEEVFLNAFECFAERPSAARLGQWFEDLIDPSLRELADHFDDEQMSISVARTLEEMEQTRETGAAHPA
jgi:hypothetical protein